MLVAGQALPFVRRAGATCARLLLATLKIGAQLFGQPRLAAVGGVACVRTARCVVLDLVFHSVSVRFAAVAAGAVYVGRDAAGKAMTRNLRARADRHLMPPGRRHAGSGRESANFVDATALQSAGIAAIEARVAAVAQW
jgi:hypothetical protein